MGYSWQIFIYLHCATWYTFTLWYSHKVYSCHLHPLTTHTDYTLADTQHLVLFYFFLDVLKHRFICMCTCMCYMPKKIWGWSVRCFTDSSVGKESTCNAGDPSSIPGSGRSAGDRIGYPLQCFWSSVVAQLVKNTPAVLEIWVQSLGWEDLLEKE